jgi:hypothetical protein
MARNVSIKTSQLSGNVLLQLFVHGNVLARQFDVL